MERIHQTHENWEYDSKINQQETQGTNLWMLWREGKLTSTKLAINYVKWLEIKAFKGFIKLMEFKEIKVRIEQMAFGALGSF